MSTKAYPVLIVLAAAGLLAFGLATGRSGKPTTPAITASDPHELEYRAAATAALVRLCEIQSFLTTRECNYVEFNDMVKDLEWRYERFKRFCFDADRRKRGGSEIESACESYIMLRDAWIAEALKKSHTGKDCKEIMRPFYQETLIPIRDRASVNVDSAAAAIGNHP